MNGSPFTGLYVDGPNGGYNNQWVADQFVATGSGIPGELYLALWVTSGQVPTTVTYWLGSNYMDSSISGGSAVALTPSMYSFVSVALYGYDLYAVTLPISGAAMSAGNTYWLTVGNANDSAGYHNVAWDYSAGPAGCYFNQYGTYYGACYLAGETFAIYTSNTPEPSSFALLGSGLIGVASLVRRKLL